MTTAYVKKNTEGGAAGLFWEAGEVKALDSRFADELVRLSPGDYEQVSKDEFTPEPTEEIVNTEEPTEEPPVTTPTTARKPYKKKSETPSAE